MKEAHVLDGELSVILRGKNSSHDFRKWWCKPVYAAEKSHAPRRNMGAGALSF
jgi:hypothetical protein